MSWTFAPHAPLTLLGQAFSVYPAILQWIFSQCLGPQGRKLRKDKYNKPQGDACQCVSWVVAVSWNECLNTKGTHIIFPV